MPRFVTDWKKIGQSGPTIDGRNINPEWLNQMAESYDPAVYTANIWVEHRRYYGTYGQVRELKAEKDGNITSLYARLMPNQWLLDINRQEQKLFTSMELDPEFAGTGKCYLVGLGVTDEPASLGTQELMFSKRKQQDRNRIICGVELKTLRDDDERGAIGRLVDEFTRLFKKMQPDTQPDEDPMDKEQFNKVMSALDAHSNAIADLGEKFVKLKVGADEPGGAPADGGMAEQFKAINDAIAKLGERVDKLNSDGKEPPATPEGNDTAAQFKSVTDAIAKVTEKLSAMEKRMETAAPGTQTTETTQPAGDGDELY